MGGDRRTGGMRLGAVLAIALTPTAIATGCVDGVTPDCSDAATQCGPNLDATTAADRREAAPDSALEAAPDSADLDSGDSGDANDSGDED
jgi:hypothetical protein